jgi:hypothetical protein
VVITKIWRFRLDLSQIELFSLLSEWLSFIKVIFFATELIVNFLRAKRFNQLEFVECQIHMEILWKMLFCGKPQANYSNRSSIQRGIQWHERINFEFNIATKFTLLRAAKKHILMNPATQFSTLKLTSSLRNFVLKKKVLFLLPFSLH